MNQPQTMNTDKDQNDNQKRVRTAKNDIRNGISLNLVFFIISSFFIFVYTGSFLTSGERFNLIPIPPIATLYMFVSIYTSYRILKGRRTLKGFGESLLPRIKIMLTMHFVLSIIGVLFALGIEIKILYYELYLYELHPESLQGEIIIY